MFGSMPAELEAAEEACIGKPVDPPGVQKTRTKASPTKAARKEECAFTMHANGGIFPFSDQSGVVVPPRSSLMGQARRRSGLTSAQPETPAVRETRGRRRGGTPFESALP